MNIKKSAFIACLIMAQNAYSQHTTHTIKGKLVTDKKEVVSDASIAVLKTDKGLAGGNLSDESGIFYIESIPSGDYSLKISALGYKEKSINDIHITDEQDTLDLKEIYVAKSENILKTVEVTHEKKMLEMNIDKKTFNVDKNITSTGGNATDVLQNVPSVSVDADGGVSLRGKSNVNILIDGRPATLLAGDVASALQALPAASIESVEVITNPSAKYDAQGSTGIINIVTKANKNQGLNGSVTLGSGTRGKQNGGLNINFRKNKWNIALNSNFRINNNYNRSETIRNNKNNDSGSFTTGDYQRVFNGWFNSLTIGYTPNESNTFTFTQNVNTMRFGREGSQEFDLFSRPGDTYSIQERAERFSGGPFSLSSSMNWKHKFAKPKRELTADLNVSTAKTDIEQRLETLTMDGRRNVTYGNVLQEIPSNSAHENLNAQLDYSTPFLSKEGKLELGAKSQNVWFRTSNNPVKTMPDNSSIPDIVLQNEYNYGQYNHAAYASFSDKQNKWSYQGGLRLEYIGYEGQAGTTRKTEYSNHFLNLFPSAYLAYQLGKDQQLYLNYSKRTQRPSFRRMMPYLDISNALDTNSGNPDLKPEFINNIEFAYNLQSKKGHTLLASLYYQYTENLMQNYTKTYADGTSFSQPVNLNSGNTYGLELIGKAQITKPWDATLSTNFFQNTINGSNIDPSVNNEGFSWFAKLNSNYKITRDFSVQIMGNYESAKPTAQGELQKVYWMDIGLRTNLMNNRASLTFNVSDIFDTRKYTTLYNLPDYLQTSYRNRETQIATITFTYKFGKTEWGNTGGGGSRRRRGNDAGNSKKNLTERDSNLQSSGGEEDGGQ